MASKGTTRYTARAQRGAESRIGPHEVFDSQAANLLIQCRMAETSIEWTDATWNPVAGCTVLTAGCTNCYAMRMAARLEMMGLKKYEGLTRKSGGRAVWTGRIRLDRKSLGAPRAWAKPRKVFVNSMSDLFHPEVPKSFILRFWEGMKDPPRHTYQILTK